MTLVLRRRFEGDETAGLSPVLSDGLAFYTPGLSERRSGQDRLFHPDRLGSIPQISSAYPGSVAKREYRSGAEIPSRRRMSGANRDDAFGVKSRDVGGSSPTPWGYAGSWGYHEDEAAGVIQVGHRTYDPTLGRILTRDPAMDGSNWYAYCSNNPTGNVDPTSWRMGLYLSATVWFFVSPKCHRGCNGSFWA